MTARTAPADGPGRVVFLGAVHEARPALAALLDSAATVAAVITPTERARRTLSGAVDLATPARRAGVPAYQAPDVNAPEIVSAIRWLRPDLLVVVGWTRLLGPELLAVPRYGCVGFHASLLPRLRGRAPVNWAIIRGEQVTGNTMLLLDPGVDTGDIVDQRPVPITVADTCATVYHRVALAGADMLRAHLPALLTGTAPRRPQDPAAGEVLPRRTPDMGLIDWDRPARAVHDWVRALTTPYPGAFGELDGRRVQVWQTRPPTAAEPSGPPGAVLGFPPGGVRVGTAGGSVVVTRMSAPEAAPAPASSWCHAAGITVGSAFAPVPPEVARWCRGETPAAAR